MTRLERATRLFRRFPFRAPSYDIVDVPRGDDVVAFDVRRCPVAEYFQSQGLSQVCVDAWCNLDVPLARKWGARLERTGTLAQSGRRSLRLPLACRGEEMTCAHGPCVIG